ncbi:hypothetical protein H4582DRAFT_2028265 [Lactarius indigo]|nr:hypothetical protein H4582DRAFT_2028265 [Lactarius indigo]
MEAVIVPRDFIRHLSPKRVAVTATTHPEWAATAARFLHCHSKRLVSASLRIDVFDCCCCVLRQPDSLEANFSRYAAIGTRTVLDMRFIETVSCSRCLLPFALTIAALGLNLRLLCLLYRVSSVRVSTTHERFSREARSQGVVLILLSAFLSVVVGPRYLGRRQYTHWQT